MRPLSTLQYRNIFWKHASWLRDGWMWSINLLNSIPWSCANSHPLEFIHPWLGSVMGPSPGYTCTKVGPISLKAPISLWVGPNMDLCGAHAHSSMLILIHISIMCVPINCTWFAHFGKCCCATVGKLVCGLLWKRNLARTCVFPTSTYKPLRRWAYLIWIMTYIGY